MNLSRLSQCAVLAFTFFLSSDIAAQINRRAVNPFLSASLTPLGRTGGGLWANQNFGAVDASLGVRHFVHSNLALVALANGGTTFRLAQGEDASCTIRPDGLPGCVPHSPPSFSWLGTQIGAEYHRSRIAVGLLTGPAGFNGSSFRLYPSNNDSKGAELGWVSRLELTMFTSKHVGVSLAAANRYLPSFRGSVYRNNTFGAGLTFY